MEEPAVDRAAMIENASRSLRQQMARAGNVGAAGRPRSKGSLNSGNRGQSQTGFSGRYQHATDGRAGPGEQGRGENAQRRIRSAENQHRQVSAVPREGPHLNNQGAIWHPNSATPQFASVAEPGAGLGPVDPVDGDLEVALEVFGAQGAAAGAATTATEDEPPPNLVEFPQEMKRPASRKKDPSASAAVGLGNLNGPTRISDAFAESQKRTRQPIPVESWGPRPPSRAGVPQKSAPLDGGHDAHGDGPKDPALSRSRPGGPGPAAGRQAEKAQAAQASALGGTWACARQEPLGAGEARRGRQSRAGGPPGPHGRASPAGARPGEDHADLGVFGHGQPRPSRQPVSKSTSGALEPHQLREPKAAVQQTASPQPGAWASALSDSPQGVGALEVSGSHIGEPGTPATPSGGGTAGLWCGSPPPRGAKGRYAPGAAAEPVSVEDVEAPPESDLGLAPGAVGHRAGPQVIFNRTISGPDSRSRGDVRRSTVSDRGDQRAREGRGANRPIAFSTALDADFLSLFAS